MYGKYSGNTKQMGYNFIKSLHHYRQLDIVILPYIYMEQYEGFQSHEVYKKFRYEPSIERVTSIYGKPPYFTSFLLCPTPQ